MTRNSEIRNRDDSRLGEALGDAMRDKAIRDSIADAPARPPVHKIAERAAARVKTRRMRQSAVGIAASAALMAGGFAVWTSLDEHPEQEILVVDYSSPPAEIVPAASSEAPETLLLPAGTGLQWSETDSAALFGEGAVGVEHLATVGDGRVLALRHADTATSLVVSENGADWADVLLPDGFTLEAVDIAEARWLAAGRVLTADGEKAAAFYSDNQGADWQPVVLPSEQAGERVTVTDAMVSGQDMVVSAAVRTQPDVAAVIAGRGLLAEGETFNGWTEVRGSTVTFARDGCMASDLPDMSSQGQGPAGSSEGCSAPGSFELTAEEEEFLYGGEQTTIRLYHIAAGQNPTATVTGEYPGWAGHGDGTADGFRVLLLSRQADRLLVSADGSQWVETPLATSQGDPAETVFHQYDMHATSSTLWTSNQPAGVHSFERFPGVYGPPLIAGLPEGFAHVNSLSAAPSGIAMVAVPGIPGETADAAPQIGWSTDGAAWSWATLSEAFGLEDTDMGSLALTEVEIAVGADSVLARVTAYDSHDQSDGTQHITQRPARWFTASIG